MIARAHVGHMRFRTRRKGPGRSPMRETPRSSPGRNEIRAAVIESKDAEMGHDSSDRRTGFIPVVQRGPFLAGAGARAASVSSSVTQSPKTAWHRLATGHTSVQQHDLCVATTDR
jgi:hypothetical protein